jgi:hypothetical protein
VNLSAGGDKIQSLLKRVFARLSLAEARREFEAYHQERTLDEARHEFEAYQRERTKMERQVVSNRSPWGTVPLTTYSPDHLEREGVVWFSSEGADCVTVVVAKGIYIPEGLSVTQFCVPVYATLPGSEEKLWLQAGGGWETEAQLNKEWVSTYSGDPDRTTALPLKNLLLTGRIAGHYIPFYILPYLSERFNGVKAANATRSGIHLTELAQYAVARFDELPATALCEIKGEGMESAVFVQRRFYFKTPALVPFE